MAVNVRQLEAVILAKTRRAVVSGEPGDGSAAARQFDAVALCAGFTCSRELLERLSGIEPGRVIDIAAAALEVVRKQAGDHVRHHSYFIDFPENVPDTMEFWAQCLPSYGRYQHSYADMLWAAPDWRDTLDQGVIAEASALIDAEIMTRLPATRIVIDEGIAGAALPLSGKPLPAGLGVFPRGSVTKVDGELLRFFIYWRQRRQRTDYDLSALFLDEQYGNPRHISWTRLSDGEAEHSGDLTQAPAPDGASEFINIRLTHLGRGFIVPQVYIYAGEGFEEVDESFFGFMTRDGEQQGQPFEARTVRMKSALYGTSRTAVPLVFSRGEDGAWRAKWLHLYLRGHGPAAWGGPTNQVEGGRVTTTMLARSVVEREYLRVGYLADLWRRKGCEVTYVARDGSVRGGDSVPGPASEGEPVTYLGLEPPADLPAGSEVFTLDRLGDLIPA
jgi:hypothetical protein